MVERIGRGAVVVRWAFVGPAPEEGRRLLRSVVASETGCHPAEVELHQRCTDCGGPHGRPIVTVGGRSGPHVSLARAGGLAVVALAGRDVGVDVERCVGGTAAVAAVALSPAERRAAIGAVPLDDVVLRAWVRKEAVLKATGDGLRVDPATVELADDPLRVASWGGAGRRPRLALADVGTEPGYLAAVALRGRRLRVDARRAEGLSAG